MTEEVKRGAPLGNQNARKYGYYTQMLDENQQIDFEQAAEISGIDDEIGLLRFKIKSLVQSDPENVKLIVRAVDSLAKLIRMKHDIGKNDKSGLREAIGSILKDIALPVGTTIGSILKK